MPVSFLGGSSPIDLSNGELNISVESDLREGVLILVGDIADAYRKRDQFHVPSWSGCMTHRNLYCHHCCQHLDSFEASLGEQLQSPPLVSFVPLLHQRQLVFEVP